MCVCVAIVLLLVFTLSFQSQTHAHTLPQQANAYGGGDPGQQVRKEPETHRLHACKSPAFPCSRMHPFSHLTSHRRFTFTGRSCASTCTIRTSAAAGEASRRVPYLVIPHSFSTHTYCVNALPIRSRQRPPPSSQIPCNRHNRRAYLHFNLASCSLLILN